MLLLWAASCIDFHFFLLVGISPCCLLSKWTRWIISRWTCIASSNPGYWILSHIHHHQESLLVLHVSWLVTMWIVTIVEKYRWDNGWTLPRIRVLCFCPQWGNLWFQICVFLYANNRNQICCILGSNSVTCYVKMGWFSIRMLRLCRYIWYSQYNS